MENGNKYNKKVSSMINILHLTTMDSGFVNMAYKQFNEAGENLVNNKFFYISNNDETKHIDLDCIEKINSKKATNKIFINTLKNYDAVVLHMLTDTLIEIVKKTEDNVNFVWIGWSGDYYRFINNLEWFLPKTKTSMLLAEKSLKSKLKSYIKTIVGEENIKYIKRKKIIRDMKILNKINFFAPVLNNEFNFIKENIKDFRAKFIDWNYGNLEDSLVMENCNLDDIIDTKETNILIGNSSFFINNHIEAFNKIEILDSKNYKIFCPLSYGNFENIEIVKKYGNEKFGKNFYPLCDFINANDYKNVIKSCSVVVMNHLNQQALGNIVIAMWFGSKIFLNKQNLIYQFFKQEGAFIFSMEELDDRVDLKRLNIDEIIANRKILLKHWSRESSLNKTKNLISLIVSPSEMK